MCQMRHMDDNVRFSHIALLGVILYFAVVRHRSATVEAHGGRKTTVIVTVSSA